MAEDPQYLKEPWIVNLSLQEGARWFEMDSSTLLGEIRRRSMSRRIAMLDRG